MKKFEKILKDLTEIKIQGGSNVAFASLKIIPDYLKNKRLENKSEVIECLLSLRDIILKIRPTEALVLNFYFLLTNKIKEVKVYNYSEYIKKELNNILMDYKLKKKKLVKYGVDLVLNKDNLFTHCRSSLVESILIKAKKQGKNFHVYNSETRPLFQGRIMAKNLIKNKVNVTMVCDSAAPFLISNHSGDEIRIDKVFLGADVIGLNGVCVNKIGSFGLALAAHESNIPLYVAASLLKADPNSTKRIIIPLEKRKGREIWPEAPKGIKLENYAFDYIPAKFITAYVTEFGLIKPRDLGKAAKKHYPNLF